MLSHHLSDKEKFENIQTKKAKKDDKTTTREDVKNVSVFDKKMLLEEQLKLSGVDMSEIDDEKKKVSTQKKELTTLERTSNLRKALSNR